MLNKYYGRPVPPAHGFAGRDTGPGARHPTLQRGPVAGIRTAHPAVDGIPVDQTILIVCAAVYVAAMAAAFLLSLPLLIGFGLLLLLSGTASLVLVLLRAVTVGVRRSASVLARTPAGDRRGQDTEPVR